MRLRIVLISIVFVMFTISGCGTNWTTKNPNPECEILSANIVPTQVEAGSTHDVIITAKVKSGKLIRENQRYGIYAIGNAFNGSSESNFSIDMFDDGKHRDGDANDGIFGAIVANWQAPDAAMNFSCTVVTFFTPLKKEPMFKENIGIEVLEKKVAPVVNSFEITPSEIEVKLEHSLVFKAKVSDENGLDDISSVTVDLTEFGGDAKQEMSMDAEAGEGIYIYLLEKYLAPEKVTKLAATVEVTDDANMTTTMKTEISTYPTPNHAPEFEKITVTPKRIFYDTTINLIFSVMINDQEGYNDIKSVTVDLSALGINGIQTMLDDGRHYDNISKDSIFGFYVERFTPVRESRKYEIKFKAIDSKGETTEASEFLEVIDPATLNRVKDPTLDDSSDTEAPDEIKDKFRSMFDGLTSSIFLKEKGEGENKTQATRIIIKEENSWDPGISGYTGFREGGMKLVMPVSWKISRNHRLDISNWKIEFPAGYINIEMLPYKAGDNDTLKNLAQKYHENLKTKYKAKQENGEILSLNYDERFSEFNRFLDQKAIWFDFYVVTKDSENVTHSVYMFYAPEASSSIDNPVYRTFKIEFVLIPMNFRTKAFDIFVDNFSVN